MLASAAGPAAMMEDETSLWRSIEERREEKDGLTVMRTLVLGFGAGRGPDNIENHIFSSCMSRRLF